ncbi:MAG: hypothetical protein WD805_06310, partial [Gaiellaceae bacterium]
MVRAATVLVVLVGLATYYAVAEDLRGLSDWGDVAFLALVLIPATFLLVWLALPARDAGAVPLAAAAVTLGAASALLDVVGLEVAANFTKMAAVVAAGWWFLAFFESVAWVLLVAVLII